MGSPEGRERRRVKAWYLPKGGNGDELKHGIIRDRASHPKGGRLHLLGAKGALTASSLKHAQIGNLEDVLCK
jgi:hypothetical protein